MLSSGHSFANGMTEADSGIDMTHLVGPAAGLECEEGASLFARFVSIYQSNDFLFAELKSVKMKLVQAQIYLASPASNRVFAQAHLQQLKARHSAVLTMLRANRLQGRALLDCTETRDEAGMNVA